MTEIIQMDAGDWSDAAHIAYQRFPTPPPALEGAGGEPTFSTAAAMRAALGIAKPFEAPPASPVEQARALMGVQA